MIVDSLHPSVSNTMPADIVVALNKNVQKASTILFHFHLISSSDNRINDILFGNDKDIDRKGKMIKKGNPANPSNSCLLSHFSKNIKQQASIQRNLGLT